VGQRFHGLDGRLDLAGARFDGCTFDNCSARGGFARHVEVVNCTVLACWLHDLILEDCLLENLKTALPGGGRRMPFFLDGVMTRRVVLRGTIGSIIWNPPGAPLRRAEPADFRAATHFYAAVDDWALDVSESRFRSVPSFRFGPPGSLVRRDPETQPLISRHRAQAVLADLAGDVDVWRVVLEDFVASPWPDEIVLVPGIGGARQSYQRDLAGLDRLRGMGAFEE
jgi:hypothetical protein